MVAALEQLQNAGVEPDVWKIEGLDRREDCLKIVEMARRDGREQVGCIILGRGSNEQKVVEWLRVAAAVPGFIGFAVGRTSFWEPLVAWRDGNIQRQQAVENIARGREWSRDDALIEILRGRLEGQGPVTEDALAAPLGFATTDLAAGLAALQTEGFALRGRFTPGATEDEWCERRLLARIHRYTINRLRVEIEPVAARDFLRFLLRWQRVEADARVAGPDAVDAIVGQLEGFEASAGAWESEILAARIAEYEPAWLDDQCLAGRIAWARLKPRNGRPNGGERQAAPVRSPSIDQARQGLQVTASGATSVRPAQIRIHLLSLRPEVPRSACAPKYSAFPASTSRDTRPASCYDRHFEAAAAPPSSSSMSRATGS